jgi:hypothetical protein
VTVNNFLPTGVTYVSARPSQGADAVVSGNYIKDNLGSIASGKSATLAIVVKVNASGTITDSANTSGSQYDPSSSNNSTSIVVTAS